MERDIDVTGGGVVCVCGGGCRETLLIEDTIALKCSQSYCCLKLGKPC